MISLYSKSQASSYRLTPIEFPYNYGLPAAILVTALLLFLWLGNRFMENTYLYLCEIMSSIIAVTTSKNTAVFPMLYGQLDLFRQIAGSEVDQDYIREVFLSMIGVSFILPGPLAKSSVLVGSYLFGFWGAVLSYIVIFGFSLLFMCIFMSYGHRILKSENYRKIVTSISCVNRGLMLYLVNPS